jgi:hypothetical protein
LDLDTIRDETGLLMQPAEGGGVPALHDRGVTVEWLVDFAKSADRARSRYWEMRDYQSRGSLYFDNVPDPPPPLYARGQEITSHFLTAKVVQPLTAAFVTPLYSLVPEHARAKPDLFLSHAWGNPLVGCASSELLALYSSFRSGPAPKYVWLDIVSYNQHRAEAIAADMKTVVASIGCLGLPLFNELPFRRLWCLWELLCAHIAGAEIVIFEPNTSAHDLGLVLHNFEETFISVDRAETTVAADRDAILSAMVDTFGSIAQANAFVREAVASRLTSDADKPWNRGKPSHGSG